MKVRLELRPRAVEGIPCRFPIARLRVRDRYGTFAELDFRIDTQADFTTIPIETARSQGIPFSEAEERTVVGLVGETTVYRGRVRLVIAGREHDRPCHFIRVPALREPGRPSGQPLPALGRAGFLDEYAITVDSGYLIVTRLGPVRRWVRQCREALWKRFGLVHPPERPL
jgi:hypothetical protein